MIVDPVLAALAVVAESVTQELAVGLAQRQWARNRRRDLSPARVRKLVEGSADRVIEAVRRDEADDVPEPDWRAAAAAVRDSLHAVSPIEVTDALALDMRPERLAAHVRDSAVDVRWQAGLGEAGEAAYDRILDTTCTQIMAAVHRLPGFSDQLQVAAFQDVRDLRRTVDRLAGPADQSPDPVAGHEFERRYRDHIVSTLGRLELFGVSRGRAPRTLPFDTAYVSVAVARSGGARFPDDDDELTGAGVEVASAFADHPRVLLRGGAGAGKTTLLRWLAVSAAQDREDADRPETAWAGTVPFFVPLRHYARRPFPTPEALPESVAGVIAAEMPTGWVSDQLRADRAMVLVDGLDELEPGRRLEARDWMEQLATAYPGIRFVVSARPFAVPEDWLASAGFVTFDLLPLSPTGIREFLGAWHEAARQQHASDPGMQDWLDACERGLRDQLRARLELRRLAGNPLLCGLLCALYQDRNMHLPRDRKGLYEAALDLLLVRWDEERGVRVDELPWLSKEEQIVLLQRFAYSLVKNHDVAVAREDAARRFAHAMRGLRSQDVGAEPVLQRTLERTGLLREPSPDEVQFVHRTFRDYLAAKEVVDCGDLDLLVEQAHLDHWHDVVVNAVAHARPAERDQVLRKLVAGNTAARNDERIRNRLHLVAAACLEQADVLDTDEARQTVQEAAGRLVPPSTLDDADLLARAGSFVLDLLPGPLGLSPAQAACVVRTAAMIGGEGVREKLAEFVPIAESRVIDELLRAWRRSEDPDSYARTVLADVDFGDRSLEVRGWHRVRCLPHLRHLTSVVCYGDFASLDPLAAVPRLRRLELVQNELVRDLSPLAGRPTLTTLHIRSGCGFLRDLAPLGETTVEELGLHLVAADLRTLRPGRLRRLIVRDQRLRDGLDLLPADLGLRELILDNPPRSRSLRGVERWQQLEYLSFQGLPRPDELDALAKLPGLSHVALHCPGPDVTTRGAEALGSLGALPGLRRLDITDVPAGDATTLGAVLDSPASVDVRVDGRPVSAGGDR